MFLLTMSTLGREQVAIEGLFARTAKEAGVKHLVKVSVYAANTSDPTSSLTRWCGYHSPSSPYNSPRARSLPPNCWNLMTPLPGTLMQNEQWRRLTLASHSSDRISTCKTSCATISQPFVTASCECLIFHHVSSHSLTHSLTSQETSLEQRSRFAV